MDQKDELYAIDLAKVSWRTSSFTSNNGQCVEVAELPDGAVAVRDSKNPQREALRFTEGEWKAFLAGVHAGEFDS
jgi:predicted secreted Zn-dependent protease